MARTAARLTDGSRITDYISLGVVAKTFPRAHIEAVLEQAGRSSIRQRELPAHVVVYYVIALALFMQASYREVLRCLLEGLHWMLDKGVDLTIASKSSISGARTRVGWEPLRQLHDEIVKPIATEATQGAWYRHWRLVSIDGSTLDVPDEEGNRKAFGKLATPRGECAFPKIRFVALVENGTHVLFGSQMDSYEVGEVTLAERLIPQLKPGMLCLADRGYIGYRLWKLGSGTGADLLWRLSKSLILPREKKLEDGSFLTTIYESASDRRKGRNGIVIRVVEYTLEGIQDAEPFYRVGTTVLDPNLMPAKEMAALYHERWEIETAFDELKTHLRGRQIVLRSKTPDLVRQEFYGLLMAHFAIRGLMHEAAIKGGVDPDRLSFMHAVHVVRRKMTRFASLPPSGDSALP